MKPIIELEDNLQTASFLSKENALAISTCSEPRFWFLGIKEHRSA
jgi:hypothetical protein